MLRFFSALFIRHAPAPPGLLSGAAPANTSPRKAQGMTGDDLDYKPPSEQLRLLAMDEEDLAVVSAHLQDAAVRVGDMAYVPRERRFALLAARFDWLSDSCARCRTGLHFEDVTRVSLTGFTPDEPDRVLNLLSVGFTPGEAPAGTLILTFSGGAAVRLDVDCLEAQMRDLGPRWAAQHRPGHRLDDEPETT